MRLSSSAVFDMTQLLQSRQLIWFAGIFPYLLRFSLATCYYPDGSVPTTYVPCNSTADGADSACCSVGDLCSIRGYCHGNVGFMYRGGCTDRTWTSPNCAAQCKQGTMGSFQPSPIIEARVLTFLMKSHWTALATSIRVRSMQGHTLQTGVVAPEKERPKLLLDAAARSASQAKVQGRYSVQTTTERLR